MSEKTVEMIIQEIKERIEFVKKHSDYIQPIYAEEELNYLLSWITEKGTDEDDK